MDSEHQTAFEVIRVRSLLLEALMHQFKRHQLKEEERLNIIEVGLKTSDVIEHIAQDALSNEYHADFLRQSLDTALHLLDKFAPLLQESGLHVPTKKEITQLLNNLNVER